jgi:ssDNA-binding Zn-finger/Zn-ribbon topoisomerase 1
VDPWRIVKSLGRFGWPLRCPKCPEARYYGRLKVPGDAAGNKTSLHCPNCGAKLVAI